jgi:hypothetical protein
MSNGLVYRFGSRDAVDWLRGGEGTFNICTVRLVAAVTRAGRSELMRLEQAPFVLVSGVSNLDRTLGPRWRGGPWSGA